MHVKPFGTSDKAAAVLKKPGVPWIAGWRFSSVFIKTVFQNFLRRMR